MDERRFLVLTEAGRSVAEITLEKHQFFSAMLMEAGVDPKTAEKEACRIEHAISTESFERLKRLKKEYTNHSTGGTLSLIHILQITAPQAQKRCCFIAVTPLITLECLVIITGIVGVCRCQNGRRVAVSDIFLYWPGVMPDVYKRQRHLRRGEGLRCGWFHLDHV